MSEPAGPAETGAVRSQVSRDRNLRTLLRPRSVAVVGASGQATRIGGLVVKLLARHHVPGVVLPIDPKYQSIEAFACYSSLGAVRADQDIDVVRTCGKCVKEVIVIRSGFAEVGGAGLVCSANSPTQRTRAMAMCGPNCAGTANVLASFVSYGTMNLKPELPSSTGAPNYQ